MNTNILNKVLSVVTLFALSLSMTACGRTEIVTVAPEMVAPQQYAINQNVNVLETEDQILVKFKNNTTKSSIKEFNSKYGMKIVKTIPVVNVHVMQQDGPGIKAEQLVKYLSKDPMVKYAEINNVVSYSPDQLSTPVYTIQSGMDFNKMTGEKVEIYGTYYSSRSGAYIETQYGKISVVDIDGTVLAKVGELKNGSSVSVSGIVKNVKGMNLTKGIGIMPITFENAR
ncbi:MAG: S8 family serine peptidase [Candidatus Sericytochromatia bacterium]